MPHSSAPDASKTAAERLSILETLVRDLSQSQDPDDLVDQFSEGIQAAYGSRAVIFIAVRDDPPGGYVVTRFVDMAGRRLVDSRDVWTGDPGQPVQTGGFLGQCLAGARPRVLDLDGVSDPVLGDALAPYRSALLLPVYDEGRIRFWAVLLHPRPSFFDERELETMLLRVNVFSALIANKRLTQDLRRANRWIQDEIDQIAMVQRSLLPATSPAIPGLDVAGRFETYDRAGGDYYDFLPSVDRNAEGQPERWTWVIADASGHGPAAAVIVAMLHMLLRTLTMPPGGPAEMLAEMNRRLFDCHTCNHFMTAFVGSYETKSRVLSYAVAGHHPPLVRCPDGEVRRLPVDPAVPLGILEAVEPPTGHLRLRSGMALLLHTDGLAEARDPLGEPFGEDRLANVLQAARGSAEAIVDALFAAVKRHEGAARPGDDQTAIVVRVL